jgi:glucoamylase
MKDACSALILFLLWSIPASAQMSDRQYERSLRGVLSNVLENGSLLASPSGQDPNYRFHWVRDSALAWKALLGVVRARDTSPAVSANILANAENWVSFETRLQETPKLTGLGEPRFELDGRANFDPWGRPQNDGPALRALAMMELANIWMDSGRTIDVESKLYGGRIPAKGLIKRDLEFVAHHWNDQSFDLWEEEKGLHHYTLQAQKTALEKGAALALRLGDPGAASFYLEQAGKIAVVLKRFVSPDGKLLSYAIDRSAPLAHKSSPLDIAVILSAIQTWDQGFQVPLRAAYGTLRELTADAEKRYRINSVRADGRGVELGVALGRYPEDRYTGTGFGEANPWFLTTLASAEFLCRLSIEPEFTASRTQLLELANRQFNRVHHHMLPDGGLPEQFDRNNGYVRGARDLTWSYASYLTAFRACLEAGSTPAP